MNKLLLQHFILITLSFAFINSRAQTAIKPSKNKNGFYAKIGAGYTIPTASQTRDVDGLPLNGLYSQAASITPQKPKINIQRASFSSGLYANFGIGYMFNNNLGVEIYTAVGIAPKSYTFTTEYPAASGYNINDMYKQYALMPIITMPSIVIQTGNKIQAYLRGGMAIPVKTNMVAEYNSKRSTSSHTDNINYLTEIKNSFNIGFNGALGVKTHLRKHVFLYSEFSVLSLSLYVKETRLVKYDINGSNSLGQVANPVIKYSNNPDDINNASYSYPFSNMGFNLGVLIGI